MKRLMEKIVFSGLAMACLFATWPTSISPSLVNATTEGVVLFPSSLRITFGSLPSITATTELVVPRSMPTIFPMSFNPFLVFMNAFTGLGKWVLSLYKSVS